MDFEAPGTLNNVSYDWSMFWILPCGEPFVPRQHLLFNLANALFFVSYLAPSMRRGLLFMHSLLMVAFLVYSTWAWNIICAPEVFAWNFMFVVLNMGQTLYIIYQMRPVKIQAELQTLYHELFEPLQVPRVLFELLVSSEFAKIITLHTGEAYALCNVTKADRLGLLIEGRVSVLSSTHYLHSIAPMEFLDSPEFESCRTSVEEKFKVSVIAMTNCRYVCWPRSRLEFLFVKEPYIATVITALIARDITTKLYSMNRKIVTDRGSQLDIRLPSLTSTISSSLAENISQKTHRRSVTRQQKSIVSLTTSLPLFDNYSMVSLKASPEEVRSTKFGRRKTSAPTAKPSGFQRQPSGIARGLIRPIITSHRHSPYVGAPRLFDSDFELSDEGKKIEALQEIDEEYV